MPGTTDLYNPRQMTEALLESLPVRRFLSSTFFNTEVHDTKSFQIDIWKGSRRLAPIVHPKLEGKVVDREKFRTKEFTPPYLKPKKVTEADHVLNRAPGQVVYTTPGSNTPDLRATALLGQDMAEMEESIQRRVECMAAEALTLGQVTVKGDGIDTVVSFDYDATHTPTLTGAALWTASTATILKNLRDWKRLISKDSGLTATDVVLGEDAAAALMANTTLLSQLNVWNATYGQLTPQEPMEGVTFLGKLEGLMLWSYDEWYYDEVSATEKPMIPVDRAVVISRQIRATVHYGVIQDLDAGNFATRSFAKSWTTQDPSARFVLVQSAPLPVVHQPNGLVSAKVV